MKEGSSFCEESCGTNAIALSRKLKKEVYTTREENFCIEILDFYIYARDVIHIGILEVQLAIVSDQAISYEDMALCELMEESLKRDIHAKVESVFMQGKEVINLNRKQIDILILIARGMTDRAIAIEKGICIDTVKYHKKKIFQLLDVSCALQAVIKSLKLHIISMDEI